MRVLAKVINEGDWKQSLNTDTITAVDNIMIAAETLGKRANT
jgi:hypothetical protein